MNVEFCIGQQRTAEICTNMFAALGEPVMDEFGGLTMFDYPGKGVLVYVNEQGYVVTIFLYADGVDGYAESIFALPNSLRFSQSSGDVIKLLGEPVQSGRNEEGRTWDKFKFHTYDLHVEYSERTGTIRQVTVMASLAEILSE